MAEHFIPGSNIPLTKDSIAEEMVEHLSAAVDMLGRFRERYYITIEPPEGYIENYRATAAECALLHHYMRMISDKLSAAYNMPSPYYLAELETLLDREAE